jgi:hypothetical protein
VQVCPRGGFVRAALPEQNRARPNTPLNQKAELPAPNQSG